MTALSLTQQISDDSLARYADLIYRRTGIRISPQKKTLLSNRLRRRLRARNIATFEDYFKLLVALPRTDPEWDEFLEVITTHETYLYRDPGQWKWFSDEFLPAIQQEARQGKRARSLRIWSAACSTGDEPFTIACCLASTFGPASGWDIEIVATDIGTGALEQARKARFSQRAMQLVPESIRRRFFTQVADQEWEAKRLLRDWIHFQQHNLIEPFTRKDFDLVVLKNVLIYFDPDSKKKVIKNLDRSLRASGYLLSGPAEGISDLVRDYERVKPWLHRKPARRTTGN